MICRCANRAMDELVEYNHVTWKFGRVKLEHEIDASSDIIQTFSYNKCLGHGQSRYSHTVGEATALSTSLSAGKKISPSTKHATHTIAKDCSRRTQSFCRPRAHAYSADESAQVCRATERPPFRKNRLVLRRSIFVKQTPEIGPLSHQFALIARAQIIYPVHW